MAQKNRGLGRGFDALFAENSTEDFEENSVSLLSIGEIEPNKDQPRRYFDDEALGELSASIQEHGIIQPLVVRPMTDGGYQIVAGERRYRAARMAGLTSVPAVIRTYTDQQVALIALIENLQRENLNPIEEAEGIRRLIDEYGITQEQAAEKLGKSRSAVTNTLRLMNLPERVRELVSDDFLSQGHARALLGIDDKSKIEDAADTVISKKLSVRETEKLVKTINSQAEKKVKPEKRRDTFFDEVELAISGTSGRKVSVKNSKKGGKIEIEFFDKEDLQKIAKLFDE